jgi:hypothetical protein
MKRSKSDPKFERKPTFCRGASVSNLRAASVSNAQTQNVYSILLAHTSVTQTVECVINEKLQKTLDTQSTKDYALCIAQPPELVEIMPKPPALQQDERMYEEERFIKLLLRARLQRKAAKR